MYDDNEYVSLIAGLPNPDRLFIAKQPPLSRLKLEQRLRVLSDDQRQTLQRVEHTLDWQQLSHSPNDLQTTKKAKKTIAELPHAALRDIVRHRLEIRTCLVALRLRAANQQAPTNTDWGVGRWVSRMVQHWNEPHFGMLTVFPWLSQARAFLQEDAPESLERLLLEQAYLQLQRAGSQHHFDFIAVVVYVLKWNIIDRVTRYNTEAASQRFDKLVTQAFQHSSLPLDKEA